MADERKPHAFKGRTAAYKGDLVEIIRGANPDDVTGAEAKELVGKVAHFLIRKNDGSKDVVLASKCKIAAAEQQ